MIPAIISTPNSSSRCLPLLYPLLSTIAKPLVESAPFDAIGIGLDGAAAASPCRHVCHHRPRVRPSSALPPLLPSPPSPLPPGPAFRSRYVDLVADFHSSPGARRTRIRISWRSRRRRRPGRPASRSGSGARCRDLPPLSFVSFVVQFCCLDRPKPPFHLNDRVRRC